MTTKIEWAEEVWNPTTGCSKISEGCRNCYAERMAKRLAGRCGYPVDEPFRPTFHLDRIDLPLKWKMPRRVFVNSMSDLFHPDFTEGEIVCIWNTMRMCSQHTFLVLTKRAERMYEFVKWYVDDDPITIRTNIWLGVSVENQKAANERIPWLLKTPAAVRFVSVEPMLGEIDLVQSIHNPIVPGISPNMAITGKLVKRLDWVICGGESGSGARPMHPDWVRSLRDQCVDAGVPFFFKQWGEWYPSKYPWISEDGTDPKGGYTFADGVQMVRVGKKLSGNLLDGQVWDQYPPGGEA